MTNKYSDNKRELRDIVNQLEKETENNRLNDSITIGDIDFFEWKHNVKIHKDYKEFLIIHNGAEYPEIDLTIFGIDDAPDWCSLHNAEKRYDEFFDPNVYSLIGKTTSEKIILMENRGRKFIFIILKPKIQKKHMKISVLYS